MFADPMGFNLLKEKLNLTIDYVRKNRNHLHKCGAPFDYYNLSDITRIDLSNYKMFVFLFAPRISEEMREVIGQIRDKMKVYIHLPDVASGEQLDFAAVERLCQIRLEPKGTCEKAVYNRETFGFHTNVAPLFQVKDEGAETLASYENGDVAAAIKGNQVYIAVSDIPSSLWHQLAMRAGVHIYTDKEIPLYADTRLIACQFPEKGTDMLKVKEDGVYIELFTKEKYKSCNKELSFTHEAYQMMLFMKEEIQAT